MPDDDTLVFTEADVAELRAMLHECTPRWWPHHVGDVWVCDECNHRFVACEARNMGDPTSAKAIALGLLDPLTLGWRTA